MHSKSLRELPAMTYETSKCQQKNKFSGFIDFKSISETYFEKLDNAIPINFIPALRKISNDFIYLFILRVTT